MQTEEKNLTGLYYREKPVMEFDLNQTLYSTVKEKNRNNLDIEAIGFLGQSITYRKLFDNVDKLADAYANAGIIEGDVVAICTINMPIVQENLLALSKLGATSKWIDLRIKKPDLVKNINESKCKIIVVFEGILSIIEEIIDEICVEKVLVASPKDYLNCFIRALANIKDKKEGNKTVLPLDNRFMFYRKFLSSGNCNSDVKPVKFKKNRPSIIVQSSGSTGKAKSIVHTEYNFNSAMQKEAYCDLPFSVGKTIYVAIPPFVIYGLCGSLYAAMAFRMKAEMTPYVSETTIFDDLGKYEFACAAPLHYRYLYKKIKDLQNDINKLKGNEEDRKRLFEAEKKLESIMSKLSKVNTFISGGDKVSSSELLNMEHVFGTRIINGYGNNEMVGVAIMTPIYASKPASVGIPLKGVTVAIFNPTTMEPMDNGEEGELCLTSDNMFVEYLNDKEETRRIKKVHSDGREWVHTGDLGYIDKDGYVYISGRSKRLLKRAAFKISPDVIEHVIYTIPEVKECVVVGVPDNEEKEVPMAFVELNQGSKEDFEIVRQLIEQKCADELPDYEIPKYIRYIDRIPYHNNKQAFKELEQIGEEYVSSLM